MAVGFSNTNKPINPRGQDASPKGYNRAELYTGKALDFDGVNDVVNVTTSDLDFGANDFSVSAIIKWEGSFSDGKLAYAETGSSGSMAASWQIRTDNDGNLVFQAYSAGWQGVTFENVSSYLTDLVHLTFVRVGTGVSLYINGVFFSDGDGSLHATLQTPNGAFAIGNRIGANNYWNGLITQYKIFSGALTAAQVADLYNNPEKIVPTGVDNTALKLWLPMQEGAGTTAYDGSSDLTDYVTNGDFSDGTNDWAASNATLSVEGGALKVTSTGGNRPQAYQTITGLIVGRKYLLSAVARVGTTTYNMEIEISGIGASGSYNKTTNSTDTYIYTEFTAGSTTHIVQAKIDDSNVASGETGYFDDIKLLDLGNYGTISGATWTHGIGAPVSQTAVIDWNKWFLDHTNEVLIPQGLTTGRDLLGNLFENVRKQGALNLDGNSWAEVHDNASLDITDAITLEAWVYWDGVANGDGILGRWDTTNNKKSYLLFNTATNFRFYVSSDGNAAINQQNNTSISTGWNHIVGIYDGSKLYTYLNGAVDGSQNYTSGIDANDADIEIGIYNTNTATAYPNDIAQPRIYNRALTASEVLRNYNSGKNTYTND